MNKSECRALLSRAPRIASASFATLLAGWGVGAQAETSADAGALDKGASGKLEEVIVTAQFRSQNLQETPLAITAVTGETMEARGQTDLSSVANYTPGVTLSHAASGTGGSQSANVSIRGIGQYDFNTANEPGVGVYIDDVYYGTLYGSTFSLVDLDRVEILRGPQGTLSGKNSEGGSVKLFSKLPSAKPDAYLDMTYGAYRRKGLRAGSSFTLAEDKLYLRLTGMAESERGYVTRYDYQCRTGTPAAPYNSPGSLMTSSANGCVIGHEGGKSVIAVRGALRYVVNSDIEDTLTADSTTDRSEPVPAILRKQGTVNGPWQSPGWPASGLPPTATQLPNYQFPDGSYSSYSTYAGLVGTPWAYRLDPVSNIDAWGISNAFDAKFSDRISLKSITAYRETNSNSAIQFGSAPLSPLVNNLAVDYKQFSQELRLSGAIGDRIEWTVGGFYFHSKSVQGYRVNLDGGISNWASTTDFFSINNADTTSKSGFAHIEVKPIDKLTLTGGVRYTKDNKDFDYIYSLAPGYGDPGNPSQISLSFLGVDGQKSSFSGGRWDYRLTAGYQITPDINVYVQTATGFKGGGPNARPFSLLEIRTFEPETVKGYEAGLKTLLFNGRLRLNTAAFYNKMKNVQTTLIDCSALYQDGNFHPCAMSVNAGDATIKGAEVEANIRATDALSADLSVGYLDFKYDRIDPTTGITKDMVAVNTPKWKVAAGVQYAIGLGAGSLTPRVEYTYTSKQYSNPVNNPDLPILPLSLVNARLTYTTADEGWQVMGEVTNLFNKYYPLDVSDGFNMYNWVVGPPRRWAVTVKRKF